MSLATRCTACGTVFRVVQDQLRVSGGWVRCGRCGEVFNAVESLVDLEAPAEAAAPSPHGARVMEELARVAGAAPSAPVVAPPVPVRVPEAEAPSEVVPSMPSTPVVTPPAAPASPAMSPGFVRQADRAARWRRPAVRAALAALACVLVGLLAWQVHLSHHDWVAARWPAMTPWLQRLCAVTRCTVEPPRRIESLAVESSGLVRGAGGTFRLSLALRNRDTLALRVPAVDLTLTDAQGQVVARRVLMPAELGAGVTSVAAGADLSLAATLRTRDLPVVGYTIEIFYP